MGAKMRARARTAASSCSWRSFGGRRLVAFGDKRGEMIMLLAEGGEARSLAAELSFELQRFHLRLHFGALCVVQRKGGKVEHL